MVAAAAARGLDFVALTDHNTRSQYQALRELQPVFDRMVLIPGQELTMFHGHAGVLGTTGYIDFRAAAGDLGAVLTRARRIGGLVTVNHPGLPSDQRCLGCGWQAPLDASLVQAMEIVNGGALAAAGGRVRHPYSGIRPWEHLLNAGVRITAIAGSDNHDPDTQAGQPSAVGRPATVVHAEALSQPAVLDAIRRGRVFVDVEGSRDRVLEIEATSAGRTAHMGGVLQVPASSEAMVTVTVRHVPAGRVELIQDGRRLPPADQRRDGETLRVSIRLTPRGERHWLRAEVVDGAGALLLLSNPVYFNFPLEASRPAR